MGMLLKKHEADYIRMKGPNEIGQWRFYVGPHMSVGIENPDLPRYKASRIIEPVEWNDSWAQWVI